MNSKSKEQDLLGLHRKRFIQSASQLNFSGNNPTEKVKTCRKLIKTQDNMNFKTNAVKDILFNDPDRPQMLSHNQEDMLLGTSLASVVRSPHKQDRNVLYNNERLKHREMTFNALCQIDRGELTIDDLQYNLESLGYHFPIEASSDISRAVAAGRLDIKKVMQQLDVLIFKNIMLHEQPSEERIVTIKTRLLETLSEYGYEAMNKLSQLFRELDIDSNQCLSMEEFITGCYRFGLNDIPTSDLSLLFYSFDKNGDGVLQYEEFFNELRGQLRGRRKEIVTRAYQKICRIANRPVLLEEALEHFKASAHPQVATREKTAKAIREEFIEYFKSIPVSIILS
jgi:Ca2+-binding EF-hand superfamily protein